MYIDIEEALRFLSISHPIAIPTETVWGLAAKLHDEKGISEIFRLKKRPPKNPLIIHIDDPNVIHKYVTSFPEGFSLLTEKFWPGGLTFVLPVIPETIPSIARAGLPTAAFRMPNHITTLSLLEKTGPLVAPSANLSGKPSATTFEHIEEDFGASFPILYSPIQPCASGIESTILIWKNGVWNLGRPGAVSLLDIANVLQYLPVSLPHENGTPLCPGQLYRHYAPKAFLALQKTPWKKEFAATYDAVLGFSDRTYEDAPNLITMGFSHDVLSVSQRLYAALRELDAFHYTSVFVDFDIPSDPSWAPIHDRLIKAAQVDH